MRGIDLFLNFRPMLVCDYSTYSMLCNMLGFHVSSHAALPRCYWILQRQSAVARVATATRRETMPLLLCVYKHHGSNYDLEIKQASRTSRHIAGTHEDKEDGRHS